MRIGSGQHEYEWMGDWAEVPDTESWRQGWAHPGLAVTDMGKVITCHTGAPTILVFNAADGRLERSFDTGLIEGHGMTLVTEAQRDYLWIADTGAKRMPELGYEYPMPQRDGRLVKMTLEGQVVQTIEAPHTASDRYRGGRFAPTAVAVNEERHGGNGDVWVADGYGESQVHRYLRFSGGGEYLGSIDGAEGAGRFSTPHGIVIDRRKAEPELYIADRSSRRVQVYDLDGKFKRAFGNDFLTSPSAFAVDGEFLIIAELNARLVIVDRHDRPVCTLGDDAAVMERPGWPNQQNERGEPVRPANLRPCKFNSPHGLGVDRGRNIYVAEWLIGGRMTKLAKVVK
jgi:hypothetical protein